MQRNDATMVTDPGRVQPVAMSVPVAPVANAASTLDVAIAIEACSDVDIGGGHATLQDRH